MYIQNFGDDSFKANDPPYGLELLSKSARHEARLITLIYAANTEFTGAACLRDIHPK